MSRRHDAHATPDAKTLAAVFGAAAHEIKNALGPLAMTLQLAERQLLAGQPIAPADMAFARAQVRRLSRLVDDLMDLTRADLGQLAIRPRDADLCAVVADTVDTFRRGHAAPVVGRAAARRRCRCRSTTRASTRCCSTCSRTPRAIRPTARRSRVAVAARGRGASCASPSATAARGSPPAEQPRIFDRFVRGAAAEGKGGLGIGLYLCRTIVERHGGTIGVDSTVGGGAAFWIDLPR